MRSDYKHWVNSKEPGRASFVTCTCLDFAHLFKREEMRDAMAKSLLSDCRHYQAQLGAFVVMTHHIHLVIRPNPNQTISSLMQRIKTNSSKLLFPLLHENEVKQLSQQEGLNQRTFWMNSFRGNPLFTDEVWWQKVAYIHQNPRRAGFVDTDESYKWSSAYLRELGFIDEHGFVDVEKSFEIY